MFFQILMSLDHFWVKAVCVYMLEGEIVLQPNSKSWCQDVNVPLGIHLAQESSADSWKKPVGLCS